MRLLPLLILFLAACSEAPSVIPERDTEADRLLAFVSGASWDDVFQDRTGSYAQTVGGTQTAMDSVPNPLPAFLSDEPPYLDVSARDQYATRVLGDTLVAGRPARIVEARFVADGRRTQPIRYVRAVVSLEGGELLAVVVEREMRSVLFDENSRLRAELASGARGLVPGWARIDANTDVPLSDARRSTVQWERVR